MDAKRGSTRTTTYNVAGKTLDEIDKDISKKGPKDPNEGKRYAGSCLGEIKLAIGGSDFEFETKAGSSPVEVTAKLKGGSVTSSCVVTMPKLVTEKALTPAALKEWKRFAIATGVHEDGHADSCYALAVTIAKELAAMSATGKAKDEKAARVEAQKALLKAMSNAYGGSVLPDRVNADIKAYDGKTRHGESEGALLKTGIT